MAHGLSSQNGLRLIDGITIGDGNLDAFSRLRVSDPVTLFSTQLQYDLDPLQMESGTTGTGSPTVTHSANDRMAALYAGAGTGTAFIQSYQYSPYQPGKSQLIFMTGVLGAAVAGAVVDVGYFDATNGIIYRQNGTSGLQIVCRTSTSGSLAESALTQGAWNLDNLDGTGASGLTLDVTKCFILVIDLQFLGMGRVRCGFDIDGGIVWAHEFRNANSLTVPYMQAATLPVQALLTSTSGASSDTMRFKCASVISEGGFQTDFGYTFSTGEQTVSAGSATQTHILSLRPKTTFSSPAKTNRSMMILQGVDIAVTGNFPVRWELCIGSTFSAAPATWGDVDATYSAYEYSTAVGTLSAAGTIVNSGYVVSGAGSKASLDAQVSARYPITLDRAGNVRALGTWSLIVTGIGGASATRATLTFKEIR